MFKIAVLVSGGGTDLQSIIDAIDNGFMDVTIEAVISDKEGIYGIERAKNHGLKTYTFDRKKYRDSISDEILKITYGKVDLIVLAGWLSILKGELIEKFNNKIINIHPSLIPSFCGDGMYGLKVHQQAVECGVKISGCTVHFVDGGTDTGPILMQKAVTVLDLDTAETLQKRVLEQEHIILPESIKLIAEGKVKIKDRKVIIL